MGHRNELIYRNAMKQFQSFKDLEALMNKLYSFYSTSTKRYNNFWEWLELQNEDKVHLTYIFQVRWITSHLRAVKGLYKNLHLIANHIKSIKDAPRSHTEATVKKAKALHKFLLDKSALVIYPFNIEIQSCFSIESKIMQKKDDSVISQARAKTNLLQGIKKMRNLGQTDGEVHKFLTQQAICFDDEDLADIFIMTESDNIKIRKEAKKAKNEEDRQQILQRLVPNPKTFCDTLLRYDTASFVVWRHLKFSENLRKFPKLSTFKNRYIKKLVKLAEKYYPEDEMSNFEALDQRFWNDDTDVEQLLPKIRKIANLLNIVDDTIEEAFEALYKAIKDDTNLWCTIHTSNPINFWSNVIRMLDTTSSLRYLIQSSLVIPLGSAEAERAFR